MEKHLIDYIRHPEQLDSEATKHLKELTERYPYFHSARILYLKALYQQHDSSFDQELRRTAILSPSRESLFRMIEQKNYQPKKEHTIPSPKPQKTDSTEVLLDNFLAELPQENTSKKPQVIDASTDYIGYMMQQEEQDAQQSENEEMDLIDDFLKNGNGKIRFEENPDDSSLEKPEIDISNSPKNEIFTETLAQIYIKQGNFERAIEIIRRLSLKYPKKNRYFADQIRFLEKILINNKNK